MLYFVESAWVPVDQNLRLAAPTWQPVDSDREQHHRFPALIMPCQKGLFAAALWSLQKVCKLTLQLSIAGAMTHGHAQQQRSIVISSIYNCWLWTLNK